MTAKKILTSINPLPWMRDNIYKTIMDIIQTVIAAALVTGAIFLIGVHTRLTNNEREHIEFKARLDSLEVWADETDKNFGKVYKKINEDKIELYRELWEKRK